jgi:hypothetical protein
MITICQVYINWANSWGNNLFTHNVSSIHHKYQILNKIENILQCTYVASNVMDHLTLILEFITSFITTFPNIIIVLLTNMIS